VSVVEVNSQKKFNIILPALPITICIPPDWPPIVFIPPGEGLPGRLNNVNRQALALVPGGCRRMF